MHEPQRTQLPDLPFINRWLKAEVELIERLHKWQMRQLQPGPQITACEHVQQRDGRWVIVDLSGKGGRIRTVPMPAWVKSAIDTWTLDAGLTSGIVFRPINRGGRMWGSGFSEKVVWQALRKYAAAAGFQNLAPHDLRRTCAKLCRNAGGELEQIQFLLGHASITTTERYLGSRQNLTDAPNEHLGLQLNT